MMITIYHLGASQSDRIVWLMEELNLPYNLEWFDRGADMLAPPEYRALHPVGTSPIIRDGERVMAESAAIVEYISQRYGQAKLSIALDHECYPDYLYWMQFNNNLQQLFFTKLGMGEGGEGGATDIIKAMTKRREDAYYHYLNDRLAESAYLAGPEFSCADIMVMFNLTALPLFGGRGIDDLEHVKAYVDRVSQRPAYIKAMAIAGPAAARPA